MTRKTALVVAPGRGTYNKEELGYFARHHAARAELLSAFDVQRRAAGQVTLAELDGADRYSMATYSRGDNASGLIHACAVGDFMAIDRNAFDIVGVTGNSMGWYIALACAGALDRDDGFRVVNTMGTLMQEALIGGQLLFPFVDENWVEIPGRRALLLALCDEIPGLYVSIHLGGMIVFAGDEAALKACEERLAPLATGRFPMRLTNHAGFHSPLQAPVAARGQAVLDVGMFRDPELPLVDGRGQLWYPFSSDAAALRDYTLGHQVVAPYDFTAAIRTGLRELAPEVVIVLGPGTTLGGAVAQALIAADWQGLTDKTGFAARQESDPVVLSMGIETQRKMVTG